MSEWPYKSRDVVLVPYGSNILQEEFLASMYYRLRNEHLLKITFPGSKVTSTLNQFISFMSQASGLVIPCRKDGEKVVPIGGGWLCEFDTYAEKGNFGFFFFKEAWGKPENIDGSMLMLRYWFTAFKLQRLYASTLATNRLAVKYSRHYGFHYLCRMPGFFGSPEGAKDAELIFLERSEFEPIFKSWSAERQLQAVG